MKDRQLPDPKCKACHGRGIVSDWVPRPFGPGNVRMDSECECTYTTEESA